MKKKEIIFIAILIILIFVLLFIKNNRTNTDDSNGIENEEYYIEKEKEYNDLADEYENILSQYIDDKFSSEEKEKINEFNKKMSDAILENDKEKRKQVANEKEKYINDTIEKRLSEKEKKELNQKQEKIDELYPIIEEYIEKQIEQEEKDLWKYRKKLSDGTIISENDSLISEKKCENLTFTNISIRYNSNEKKSYFSANVKNDSDSTINKQTVSIKISGDVEAIYPLDIEELWPNEYYDFEIEITNADITLAENLEIIPYNEADYANQQISE